MIINLNKKIDSQNQIDFDKFAISFIEKIKEINIPKQNSQESINLSGSLAQKDLWQMPPTIEQDGSLFNGIVRGNEFIAAEVKGKLIGLEKKSLNCFIYFVNQLHEKHKSNISYEFVEKTCFTWIITAKSEQLTS